MNRRHFIGCAAGALIAGPASASRLDIPAQLGASAQFLPLFDALVAAGLLADLRARGPFTVFAPTLEAFDRIGYGTMRALERPSRRDELRLLLGFHVVPGAVPSASLRGRVATLETLTGQPVVIDGRSGGIRIGVASVGVADIIATNGIIHQIDRVLRPA